MHRITLQEYEATLEYWSERHAGILQVERVAESVEKMPIILLKITDSSVPDEDKQVCLVTALHGGPGAFRHHDHICIWPSGSWAAAMRPPRPAAGRSCS